MLFNSTIFLGVFLPLCLGGYLALIRWAGRVAAHLFLTLACLFFYSWWDIRFLPVLLLSIVVNYVLAMSIESAVKRRRAAAARAWLVGGIVFNLCLLGWFKYANFFADAANQLAGTRIELAAIALPIGISFFTFQKIALLVDIRRGRATLGSPLSYALFVVFFPQLIAGPIVHYRELMPQFAAADRRRDRWRDLAVGLSFLAIGLFKKVAFADQLASYVDIPFEAAANGVHLTFVAAWSAALCFSLQIYFDFSAYSDMASGLARMFGVRLPVNFLSPYKALNVREFWRRWHITLSRFLRDYVFIPLGGSRAGPWRVNANLAVTMVLGGFWHGANWTFLIWGAAHGALLAACHGWHRAGIRLNLPGGRLLAWAATFLAVTVLWVFFRARNVETALSILGGMAGANGFVLPAHYQAGLGPLADLLIALGWRFDHSWLFWAGRAQLTWMAALFLVVVLLPNAHQIMRSFHRPVLEKGQPELLPLRPAGRIERALRWRPDAPALAATATLAIASTILIANGYDAAFIYFQF